MCSKLRAADGANSTLFKQQNPGVWLLIALNLDKRNRFRENATLVSL